jgi:hypothetical protein
MSDPMSDPALSTADAAAPARPCTNCGAPLPQPEPPFCPQCGQETRVRAPKLGEFLQQFGGAYFSTEGALWRTLKLLLIEPGELTRQYLAGRRRHYVLPLRLYLTISLVVLLAIRVLGGAAIETGMASEDAVKVEDGKPWTYNLLSFGPGVGAGSRDGKFFCEGLPQWMCKRLERRSAGSTVELRGQLSSMGERLLSNLGLAMFVLLPSFALWLKLVYFNRRLHYTEHLVMALHLHAFWFAMVALTLVDQVWLTVAASCAVPVYTIVAMKRVYGGRFVWRLLRAATVFVLQLLALTVAMILVVLVALLG